MNEDETARRNVTYENTGEQNTNSGAEISQNNASGTDQQDDQQAAERFHRDFYESLDQNEQIGDENLMAESDRDLGSTPDSDTESASSQESPSNNESSDSAKSSKA